MLILKTTLNLRHKYSYFLRDTCCAEPNSVSEANDVVQSASEPRNNVAEPWNLAPETPFLDQHITVIDRTYWFDGLIDIQFT
jgi:hypothetical protein